ncbi:MAG: histidine--tRNA ligase [Verrucomicrobiales bacterium]|jgi:histidyl-tRNA synthetase|nr:histidine--tRNA ligase [Verrucomicrobiales bacterium]MDP4790914.1 histidine--tRNA ligase [Verrucomicrobiales bacterium]MDP4939745.1 histidine--tRNA ligase [Verrucomicrobiales bacterium]MDP5005414.1 histidine--tRNA ligase [Verrucomicrobiales bacterium]
MAQRFQTLPGFRDFFPDECAARNHVFEIWRKVARRYGFVEYEGPILEPTALYQRKSGAEIVNQLFCFPDKGERDVSMRPELTPTLARMAAARQRDFRKPLRWFSIGQFFRYEKHQKGRGREFYQFNCDILGEDSVLADAELIALSIDLMRAFGFTEADFRIRVSDRNAWVDFATRNGVEGDGVTAFLQVIDKMERTPEEKVAGQLAALGLTLELIRDFIASGVEASEALQAILADLSARGVGHFVEVDLSIVRGLAYYTGPVFEIFDIGKGMRAVAGGGRYDQLVQLIGGVEMAACGFAMGDMVITDLIRETPAPNALLEAAVRDGQSVDVYIVLADPGKQAEAAALAQTLRLAGIRTLTPLAPAKVPKQFQAAEQSGASFAVVVGSEYPEVTIRNLRDRSEITTRPEGLIEALQGQ